MTNFLKHKMRGKSPAKIAAMVTLGVIGIAGLAILFGFIIMWLWNWLMPEIFGLTTLTYWQAVGIFILLKILLGGMGGHSGSKKKHSKKHSKSSCRKESKNEFYKWKHYDKFWKEEGDQAYKEYVERMNKENNDEVPES
jgi:hypothetical protein